MRDIGIMYDIVMRDISAMRGIIRGFFDGFSRYVLIFDKILHNLVN